MAAGWSPSGDIAIASGDSKVAGKAILALINVWVAAGWTHICSCDGSTYSAATLQIDTAAKAQASGMFVCFEGPNGRQFLLERKTTIYLWDMDYSQSVGFTGGSLGTPPTAADQEPVLSGSAICNGSTNYWMRAYADDSTDTCYCFMFNQANSKLYSAVFYCEEVIGADPNDTDPFVVGSMYINAYYFLGSSYGSIYYTSNPAYGPYAQLDTQGTPNWQRLRAVLNSIRSNQFGAPTSSAVYEIGQTDSGDVALLPLLWASAAADGYATQIKGYSRIFRLSSEYRNMANGDTFNVDGARGWLAKGTYTTAILWDGTSVTNLSDGTDVSAVMLQPYPEGGGAATDYFQMRGWGTVSLAFVYWTVTGSPDPTGASAPEVVTDVILISEWSA